MKLASYIIALDAGFRNVGVAVWSVPEKQFVATRRWSTGKNDTRYVAEDSRLRLEFLTGSLAAIMEEFPPRYVVAEMPVGSSRSARAASCMAMAFSVVVCVCLVKGIPLKMVNPSEIKKIACPGLRSVDKQKVIDYVSRRHGTSLLPSSGKEHVADAMACLDAFLSKGKTNG